MTDLDILIRFEQERLAALVSRDLNLARLMHHDHFQLITPRGIARSRDEYLSELETGVIRYLAWTPQDISGHVIGGAGALRYHSTIDMEAEGRRLPLMHCWHTDAYEQIDGNWQARLSQATLIA